MLKSKKSDCATNRAKRGIRSMQRPFYHYLMTERDPHKRDVVTLFANAVYLDDSFPKQSEDYHEISHYLELNGTYLEEMTTFDKAWEIYLDKDN